MILQNTTRSMLSIVIDTNSIDTNLLLANELHLKNIVKYSKMEMFEIWRSTGPTKYSELRNINELTRIETENDPNSIKIKYECEYTEGICSIFHDRLKINSHGRELFKRELKQTEFESLLWLFVTDYFCHENNNATKILFITLNNTILQNKKWQLQHLH